MLQSIIDYLVVKLQALKIADVYGLCELVYDPNGTEAPALYNGSGQYVTMVDFDNHSGLMYFRLSSPTTNTQVESQVGGVDYFQRTYNIRLIAFVRKDIYNTDNNYIDDKIAHNIQLAIDEEDASVLSLSLLADSTTIQTVSYETNRRNVLTGEGLDNAINIPFDKVFMSLDFTVNITGSSECFDTYGCNDTPIDYLELLREEICIQADGTVTATNSLGTQIGSVSVASGGTANIPITDSTATVQYQNGTLIQTLVLPAETNGTVNVPNPVVCQTLTEQITDNSTAVVVQAIKDGGKEIGVQDELNGQYGVIAPNSLSAPLMYPSFAGTFVNTVDSFATSDRLYILNSLASSFYSRYSIPTNTSLGNKSAIGTNATSLRLSVDGLNIMVSSTNTLNFYNYSDNVLSGTFTVTGVLNATFINTGNIWTTQGTTIQEYTQAGATVGTAFSSTNVVRIRTLKNELGTTRVWVLGDSGAATSGKISHIDSVTKAETTVTISGLPSGLTVGIVAGMEAVNGRYFFTLRNGSTNFMAVVETTLTGVYVKHTQIMSPQVNILGISSYIALPKTIVYIPTSTANFLQYAIF